MFTIGLANEISPAGLDLLPGPDYKVTKDLAKADAILVRSANLHELDLPKNLKAIARAGSGVNNIPIEACTQLGIPVFNTPGANANSVKELVLASMLLSSRRIYQGISWAGSLAGDDNIVKSVEKGKSSFVGPEIKGKRLGVVGLGAIGKMVAADALALGMEVIGYDPFITVEAAWQLSSAVVKATSLEQVFETADYITLHVPYNPDTKGMLDAKAFAQMKPGVRIINLARGELLNNHDLLAATATGAVGCYVTDFPMPELLGNDSVITIPHLGASTPESEDNCARMAVQQLQGFLGRGSITNSVNFPGGKFVPTQDVRILVAHSNTPNMVGQITAQLAAGNLNISELLNQHRGELGYTIIDVEGDVQQDVADRIRKISGVYMTRLIRP